MICPLHARHQFKQLKHCERWIEDPVIDLKKDGCSDSLYVGIKSNKSVGPSLDTLLRAFSRAAIKFREEYKKIPVSILDNTNRLSERQQCLLHKFEDYTRNASDRGIATVVFVSNEGYVPHHMKGNFTLFIILFISYYVLIKYYKEELVV